MRLAIVYWPSYSIGGIATHLNTIRTAAKRNGDSCDILMSANQVTKKPHKFSERKWIRSGGGQSSDTYIWIDGELPHHPKNIQRSIEFLEDNYDSVLFGTICPHPNKAYGDEPQFIPLVQETDLPKIGLLTDGYWKEYSEWGRQVLPYYNAVFAVIDSYASELRPDAKKTGTPVIHAGVPFLVVRGRPKPKERNLLIWPHQWKNIKGINGFLDEIPKMPKKLRIELYSCGIRYYQLRTEERWLNAVGEDKFKGFNVHGRATYFGNVDLPEIRAALQRASFTVSFQGMNTRKAAYQKGSYNYTEVESLFYGALPILHESVRGTDLPPECYRTVSKPEELPRCLERALAEPTSVVVKRREAARAFVLASHGADKYYTKVRSYLE